MTVEAHVDPPIVDAHAHIFTTDMPLAGSAWLRPEYSFTAEQYLATLDQHGVHFGVIAGISIFGLYNDYMLAELRKHKRLRGTANVSPAVDRYTLERMKSDGVVGVRLQMTRRDEPPDLDTEEYRLLFRRLADLDMHVEAVIEGPRWPAVLKPLESSGVKIVIDHFGHPDPQRGADCEGFQAVLRAVQRGRTWVKLSAGYRLTWAEPGLASRDPQSVTLAREAARALLVDAGPERLVWGSDCPFVGHENVTSFGETVREWGEWVPDAMTRRKMSDTALRLYFS